jgi:hypothetical protein
LWCKEHRYVGYSLLQFTAGLGGGYFLRWVTSGAK